MEKNYAKKKTNSRIIEFINNWISKSGNGKNTKYSISPVYELFQPMNLNTYFELEIDERTIKETFNFNLIYDALKNNSLFTTDEISKLNSLQETFAKNISQLSDFKFK